MAACVGGMGERERPATRSSSSRKTPTNSLTPSPTRPAIRGPALRAARNYPTSSSYYARGPMGKTMRPKLSFNTCAMPRYMADRPVKMPSHPAARVKPS